jgi:hypothetical protein
LYTQDPQQIGTAIETTIKHSPDATSWIDKRAQVDALAGGKAAAPGQYSESACRIKSHTTRRTVAQKLRTARERRPRLDGPDRMFAKLEQKTSHAAEVASAHNHEPKCRRLFKLTNFGQRKTLV